ncbi:MAG: hypothetical protein HFH17_08765 [Ruminococcus sp.]|jgi:hypothetical protein|nr:hypothetical protein [Schaedlerella arabinosiphila]MCI9213102.1 hypothetical protein [Ruminococcus sp.]
MPQILKKVCGFFCAQKQKAGANHSAKGRAVFEDFTPISHRPHTDFTAFL